MREMFCILPRAAYAAPISAYDTARANTIGGVDVSAKKKQDRKKNGCVQQVLA
jgi:hypothetical protein